MLALKGTSANTRRTLDLIHGLGQYASVWNFFRYHSADWPVIKFVSSDN
jgi:hypothetical protein